MRSTIESGGAGGGVVAGVSSPGMRAAAFQAAHARFVAAAAKVNSLLDIAQANLGDAAGTYVAADSRCGEQLPGLLEPTRPERKGLVMSQIMYNYPAMMAHAGRHGRLCRARLQSLGADIASEQARVAGGLAG